MADVLAVAAFEVSDPVALVVLVEVMFRRTDSSMALKAGLTMTRPRRSSMSCEGNKGSTSCISSWGSAVGFSLGWQRDRFWRCLCTTSSFFWRRYPTIRMRHRGDSFCGLRVINFLVVIDSPLPYNRERMMATLREYRIDGKGVFDPANPESERTLTSYARFVDTIAAPPNERGMETSESLNARLRPRLIITDENMGWEWRSLDNAESH